VSPEIRGQREEEAHRVLLTRAARFEQQPLHVDPDR
jgi:hypothetical protein